MTAVVGFCPSCDRSVLVEVREWHIYDGLEDIVPAYVIAVQPSPTPRENCCVYADCPHCGGDIDQYEGAT